MPQSANLTECDKRGSEFSLYLNLGNDCSTPVWTYHKGVTGDLSLNETENENELSVRDPAQLVRQYLEDKMGNGFGFMIKVHQRRIRMAIFMPMVHFLK